MPVRWLQRGARRRVTGALAAVLAGATLAGCGSGSGPGGASSAPSAPTSSSAATGAEQTATSPTGKAAIVVTSAAFISGGKIPVQYSCNGSNTPPPLSWTGLPAGTAGIALVMQDPDATQGTFTHWVVFNMPRGISGITGVGLPAGAAQGRNSNGKAAYLGPCPPSGTHHYYFTVYAERIRLPLRDGAALQEALKVIKANAIASGQLIGLFSS